MSLRIRPANCFLVFALVAAGCAPLPYSLNFAKDNIVGIDVALESELIPDAQTGVSRSRITLVRHFVRGSEVHEVAAAIGTVMASTNLANWALVTSVLSIQKAEIRTRWKGRASGVVGSSQPIQNSPPGIQTIPVAEAWRARRAAPTAGAGLCAGAAASRLAAARPVSQARQVAVAVSRGSGRAA